jgi:hypothetical protein
MQSSSLSDEVAECLAGERGKPEGMFSNTSSSLVFNLDSRLHEAEELGRNVAEGSSAGVPVNLTPKSPFIPP